MKLEMRRLEGISSIYKNIYIYIIYINKYIYIYQYLKEECSEDGAKLLSVAVTGQEAIGILEIKSEYREVLLCCVGDQELTPLAQRVCGVSSLQILKI